MEEKRYHTMTAAEMGAHTNALNRIEPPENILPSEKDYPAFIDFNTREGKTVRYIREDNHENH